LIFSWQNKRKMKDSLKAVQKTKTVVRSKIVKLGKAQIAFPIVGVGASAGGLEAFELFLSSVPTDSGMAFVIIQHLDPTHKGMLVELLQRSIGMHVFQVKERMRVKANCVYVIPPNKDLSILQMRQSHLLTLPFPKSRRQKCALSSNWHQCEGTLGFRQKQSFRAMRLLLRTSILLAMI
jgi:chemotaxis response regulator CheB